MARLMSAVSQAHGAAAVTQMLYELRSVMPPDEDEADDFGQRLWGQVGRRLWGQAGCGWLLARWVCGGEQRPCTGDHRPCVWHKVGIYGWGGRSAQHCK